MYNIWIIDRMPQNGDYFAQTIFFLSNHLQSATKLWLQGIVEWLSTM